MTDTAPSPTILKLRAWFREGFRPEPLSALEWTLLRLAFAALVLFTFSDWHPYDFAGQPEPVGIARWIPLTWLHHDGMYPIMFGVAAAGCLFYVLGVGLRWVLPLLTAAQTVVFTYQNSQGFIYHGVQLVTMVLLFQSIVVWWKRHEPAEKIRAWLWYYSRGIILFSYGASALSKIIGSRGLWIWQSKYLCIEIMKTRRYDYYKSLEPALLGDSSAGLWLFHHPFATQLIFGAGFLVEMLAFLGLRDRYGSAVFGIAIIGFHRSVSWLMGLDFENHEWLCLIFLINLPGWLILFWKRKQKTPLTAAI